MMVTLSVHVLGSLPADLLPREFNPVDFFFLFVFFCFLFNFYYYLLLFYMFLIVTIFFVYISIFMIHSLVGVRSS